MRIGLTCYPTYGGSGAVAAELALALGRRGHEVHVISYSSPFRLRSFAENVSFHEVDLSGTYPLLEYFPYSLALAVKQHEVALREQLDILHVHYAIPHAPAAFLAKQMLEEDHEIKVVTTLHGTDITLVGLESSFFTVTKFAIERSDAVTAVSAFLRDATYQEFGCVACGIEVIPNFVNLDEFRPAAASDSAECVRIAPPGHKTLVHISNFREVKRVPDVVRVFAKVRERMPAILVLAGDGPQRPDAAQEAERLDVAEDVRFLGKVDAVAELLRAADLYLLASRSESFGLSALEAMACGVPVLAPKVGGLPEVVEDGVTGALIPLGDLEGMSQKALELLSDTALHASMRRAGIERAMQFDTDHIVPLYEDLYRRVIAR
ncbi:MAG: N-acetyl-alpha-D-glucosaminyl L-malate synthase BshA [Gemmatimonadota bacterium]|nr:MAG: N-acetyl-alpha-D-glucosaminyl L-malate synthase BshA [Gemmatimonadota bacterium]